MSLKWHKSKLCVKKSMNLVIQAALSEPPTESLPFRDVTYEAKKLFDFVLLEAEEDVKDAYWRFLLKQGMFDFIDDIIGSEEIEDDLRMIYKDIPNIIFNYPIINIKVISISNYMQLCCLFNNISEN